jgi:hypothetical protein
MKIKLIKIIKITVLILTILISSKYLLVNSVNSQTSPQIIFSWQAYNFYPSDYLGKALPTKNSLVTVSLEVVKDNKFIDLSKNNIAWYLNNKNIARGVGLKSTVFKIESEPNQTIFVKAAIQIDEKIIESSFLLPVVNPQLTLNLPYPQKNIFADSSFEIKAIPYFFNINSLNQLTFFWEVNNQRQKSDTNLLNINIIGSPVLKEQQKIKIKVLAQNKIDSFETSKSEEEVFIIK